MLTRKIYHTILSDIKSRVSIYFIYGRNLGIRGRIKRTKKTNCWTNHAHTDTNQVALRRTCLAEPIDAVGVLDADHFATDDELVVLARVEVAAKTGGVAAEAGVGNHSKY